MAGQSTSITKTDKLTLSFTSESHMKEEGNNLSFDLPMCAMEYVHAYPPHTHTENNFWGEGA